MILRVLILVIRDWHENKWLLYSNTIVFYNIDIYIINFDKNQK